MQEISCENCQKKFNDYRSNNRKYCSRSCAYSAFEVNHKHTCAECGVIFLNKKTTSRFCGLSCSGTNAVTFVKNHKGGSLSGNRHWNWRGGGTINSQGYREIPLGKKNKKILEHRMVMEKHLERKLQRIEHVHHINGDKTDNRLENLVVLSPSEHQRLHLQRRYHGRLALV